MASLIPKLTFNLISALNFISPTLLRLFQQYKSFTKLALSSENQRSPQYINVLSFEHLQNNLFICFFFMADIEVRLTGQQLPGLFA